MVFDSGVSTSIRVSSEAHIFRIVLQPNSGAIQHGGSVLGGRGVNRLVANEAGGNPFAELFDVESGILPKIFGLEQT